MSKDKRDIEVLEVTPIEKVEYINRMMRGRAPLPKKLKYGDVVTIKVGRVVGFWVRTKSRKQWVCMITGKPIEPGQYCYRPLDTGVTLWDPQSRISDVVVRALSAIEPQDHRQGWREVLDKWDRRNKDSE